MRRQVLNKHNSARLTKLLRYVSAEDSFHCEFKAVEAGSYWHVRGTRPGTTSRFVVRGESLTRLEALALTRDFISEAWYRLKRRFGREVANREVPQFRQLPELHQRILEAIPQPPRNRCFRCDGTGQLCDICGESPSACQCDPDLGVPTFSDCQDCGGQGA